jgi:hypothetical protein
VVERNRDVTHLADHDLAVDDDGPISPPCRGRGWPLRGS